ncbi:type II toxin-antitoxin system RelB/DinJ family antitoxin [uncultured Adlercreutzia sp.]|uniref:type II toxin-antitoxin system RelB/DinJ family antitoxin n=1 Tax=uncultured Adlercreutzia sp. TaxID=875803 RepID=UPI0026774D76|nr:type II toxin-antitoxin system RelB/DinJ family antitoxin [uncultured Adlercreutzia sp.]
MPTGQMNVRIDDDVRIAGNEAFESIGWTPSQAAREVWAYAARNRRNPRKLREMRRLLEEAPVRSGMSKAEEAARIVSEGLASMGIDIKRCAPSGLSDKELYHEAMMERMRARGLM